MRVYKIVLTGGPCAGKTTALSMIKEKFDQMGVEYILVPETATELMENGYDPTICDTYEFQSLVLDRQLTKERDALNYAKKNFKDISIIICDRGIFDNIAYLNDKNDFNKMLRERNLSEIELLDSYDMVIDLLSLACCKPKDYEVISNLVRRETLEEAVIADWKTSSAWANHHNIKFMSSAFSLDDESREIFKCLRTFIEGKSEQVKHRYLVDNNISNFIMYMNMKSIDIKEAYFDVKLDNVKCRIATRTIDGVTSNVLQLFEFEKDIEKLYYSRVIDDKEVSEIYQLYEYLGTVSKREINFVDNLQLYRLLYSDDRTILEVVTNNYSDKAIIPSNIVVKSELIDECLDLDKNRDKSETKVKRLFR